MDCRRSALFAALSALFLAIPETLVWGDLLATLTLFIMTVLLLNYGHYFFAMLGILLFTTLPAAFLFSA